MERRVVQFSRRDLLATTALALLAATPFAHAITLSGKLPWTPGQAEPPKPVRPGPWQFFSDAEGAAMEAIVDRLVPADPETPGGKDLGIAVFIDRQLIDGYGKAAGQYRQGPFQKGEKSQGPQSEMTPAQQYRTALDGLDRHCKAAFADKGFAQLGAEQQDQVLTQWEKGEVKLDPLDGKGFFEDLLKDVKEGLLSDPIYGGNRDMAAWKMIGFPGARYDYRDWVTQHNKPYPLPPISIMQHPGWGAP